MITPRKPGTRSPKEPLITPEADRALLKILISYGGVFLVFFILVPVGVDFINIKGSPLFPIHRFIDTISTLIILIPFFLGINRMNVERLKYGRKYASEENWKAVYYSVESFSQLGQNWMDATGEAHYLMSLALDQFNYKPEADKARQFILKHRPNSEWAAKLRDLETGRAPRRISDIKADRGDTSKKLTKSRRRF